MPTNDGKAPPTPWHVDKSDACPTSSPWAVITKDSGKTHGCFASRDAALKQLAVLYVKLKSGEIKAELEDGTVLDASYEMDPEVWQDMMAAVVASAD